MEKITENTDSRAAEIYGRFTQRYSRDDEFAEELNASIFENTRKHTGYLVQRLNREAFSAVREAEHQIRNGYPFS